MQDKKFISPGAWFSLIYPSSWSEFEDTEDSFLFYDPDHWGGNFRISAYRKDLSQEGALTFGARFSEEELRVNPSAKRLRMGAFTCVYSSDEFTEEGIDYVTHHWATGANNVGISCSFTALKGDTVEEAEAIIRSLEVRDERLHYPPEVIPVRVSEIYTINEAYEWVTRTVKETLKTDFQGVEADLSKMQRVIDKGEIDTKRREAWLSFGITLGVILAEEVEEMEWMTLIDGNREEPVLQYRPTGLVIDPMKLVWSKVKAGEACDLAATYRDVITQL
jgi:hypothetical protein